MFNIRDFFLSVLIQNHFLNGNHKWVTLLLKTVFCFKKNCYWNCCLVLDLKKFALDLVVYKRWSDPVLWKIWLDPFAKNIYVLKNTSSDIINSRSECRTNYNNKIKCKLSKSRTKWTGLELQPTSWQYLLINYLGKKKQNFLVRLATNPAEPTPPSGFLRSLAYWT